MLGEKIHAARIMAGLSLEELSRRMGNTVSKQAISKYEQGLMRPNSNILLKLIEALNIDLDYLLGEKRVEFQKIDFRRKYKIGKKELKAIEYKSADRLYRYQTIEKLLGKQIPFVNPLGDFLVIDKEDVEEAANRLREAWDLGQWALPNVLELLEDHGVKVIEVDVSPEFDGFSTMVDESPVVVLNRYFDNDLPRKRFTTLHEIGHLLLYFGEDVPERKREKLCHQFAGAFLLPENTFRQEIFGTRRAIALNVLLTIKENFGISLQATMARARTLELISERQFIQFRKWIKAHDYRINEPGKYVGIELPTRFENMVNTALTEHIISESKAASLLQMNIDDLHRQHRVYV